MFLSLLLAACGGIGAAPDGSGSDGSSSDGAAADRDSASDLDDSSGEDSGDTAPYVADEDPVEPTLTLDEVGDAIAAALAVTEHLDAGTLFDAYAGAMEGRTDTCPYTNAAYAASGVDYWYDSCETEGGTHYSGYGYGYDYKDWWSGQYFYRHNGYWFGDARIDMPDGSSLVGSGYGSLADYDDTLYGGSATYYSILGEFSSTSPLWSDTWLADGLSVSLSLSRYWYAGDSGSLDMNGGLSHMSGSVNAVQYDHLYMLSAAYGSECALEPGGTISVRDEEGQWYDVVFQGPNSGSTAAFPAECDGCGEVWFRGEVLGGVCPDLSTLTGWGL